MSNVYDFGDFVNDHDFDIRDYASNNGRWPTDYRDQDLYKQLIRYDFKVDTRLFYLIALNSVLRSYHFCLSIIEAESAVDAGLNQMIEHDLLDTYRLNDNYFHIKKDRVKSREVGAYNIDGDCCYLLLIDLYFHMKDGVCFLKQS